MSPPAGRRCHSDEPFACDVAYATHASETAAEFHRQHRRKCAGEASRRVVDAIYEEVTALAGKSQLHGGLSWDFFVDRVQKATGIELPSDQRCDLTTKCLHPMVDRLLRHQTVSWTARWAEATGRRFNLYGLGWENHPEYAKYARGAVKHGLDLGRAFRGAAVHLHAGCNPATHQRVLDGLAAGGFFLVRRHIGDVGCRFMRAAFEVIERKGVKLGETVELWKDLPVPMTEQWIAYRRMRGENPYEPAVLRQEHVDAYQRYRQSSNPPPAADLWPEFYDITFAGEDELVEKLEWFLARDDERCSIAASMRRRVLERFTYEGLMRRLLQWLTAKLGE